jgi:hypothetical protein
MLTDCTGRRYAAPVNSICWAPGVNLKLKEALFLLVCWFTMAGCQPSTVSQSYSTQALSVKARAEESKPSVICTVKNVSEQRQEYWTWTCSYWDEWKTDNEAVSLQPWVCTVNGLDVRFLEPGQSQQWTFPLEIKNAPPNGRVRFRLSFSPIVPDQKQKDSYNERMSVAGGKIRSINPLQGPFWSNEIEVEVQP